MKHTLIIDDDTEILSLLDHFLDQQGFKVSTRASGNDLWQVMDAAPMVDIVILDVLLPGKDGLTLCRELRSRSDVPIILLTALDSETDRIVGLEVGADDYLVKPFSPRELLARMRAIFRRIERSSQLNSRHRSGLVRFNDLCFDPKKRELRTPKGVIVHLSRSEFDLLLAFVDRPNEVLDRDELSEILRGRALEAYDRSVDLHVSRLRGKLSPLIKADDFIKTVRGTGYMFTLSVEHLSQ